MARMRITALAVVFAAAAAAAASAGSPRPVTCDKSIGYPAFPYAGSAGHRYRLVLDAVSVPPLYVGEPVALHERPWGYWLKAGLVVRAGGQAVEVEVPEAWRKRAAITWGNTGTVASLRIAGCRGPRDHGHAFAGGFLLAGASACVPIVFRAGGRSAIVRFGIGRRCS